MAQFEVAIIDAQYILTRNANLLASRYETLDFNMTLKIFIQSVFKLQKELQANRLFLLWDKRPYKKLEFIPEYKGDRVFDTDEVSTSNYEIRTKVKDLIIKDLKLYGIPSIIYPGFEADDWAYFLSRAFNKKWSMDMEHMVMVSADSDWEYFLDDHVELYKPQRDKVGSDQQCYYSIKDRYLSYDDFSYLAAAKGTHNFVQNILKPNSKLSDEELIEKLKLEDYSMLTDEITFKNQFKAFDLNSIFEDYQNLISLESSWNLLNTSKKPLDSSVFRMYCSMFKIKGLTDGYEEFINSLKF